MARSLGHLSSPELGQLLAAASQAEHGARDRALLELIISCGLTSGEAATLKRSDVSGSTLRLRGAKPRTVALTNQAAFHLNRYLTARTDNLPWLFIRHDRAVKGRKVRNHLTPRSIQRTLERYVRAAGLAKRITPGVLRRLFARQACERGDELNELQATLGHKHLTTTQRLLGSKT